MDKCQEVNDTNQGEMLTHTNGQKQRNKVYSPHSKTS